jgi:hypothetical protein
MGERPLGCSHDLGRPLNRWFALVTSLLVLVGCVQHVTVGDLRANAEADLTYPGAMVIGRSEHEWQNTIEGPENAYVGYVAATDAEPAEIERYFVDELARRGWAPATDSKARTIGIRLTSELSARAWRKDDLVIRLGLMDPSDPRSPALPPGAGPSIYRFDLIAQPPRPSPSS